MSDAGDFSGAYAGTAGAVGATVRWLRDGKTLREWTAGIFAGVIFGYGCYALLAWHYPNVPFNVLLFASASTGIVSGILVEFVQRIVTKFISKAEDFAQNYVDTKTQRKDVFDNGTKSAASTGSNVLGSNGGTSNGVVISGPNNAKLFDSTGK